MTCIVLAGERRAFFASHGMSGIAEARLAR